MNNIQREAEIRARMERTFRNKNLQQEKARVVGKFTGVWKRKR